MSQFEKGSFFKTNCQVELVETGFIIAFDKLSLTEFFQTETLLKFLVPCSIFVCSLNLHPHTGTWCNGSTRDSDSACLGSKPGVNFTHHSFSDGGLFIYLLCQNPFGSKELKPYFCNRFYTGLWCKGSTTDFDSVCLGSNPSNPTKRTEFFSSLLFLVIEIRSTCNIMP